MGIYISVDETFDNDHRIVSQRGSASGRFTFSAADSGEHKICFTPTNVASTQGWLMGGQPAGNIKFELDLAIGETSQIESSDKAKVEDLVGKVRDLNARLQDVRREQVFQRVSAQTIGPYEAPEHRGRRCGIRADNVCRNVRPSSEISPRARTRV